jgi:cellulose synthase/poly-beta-1,6-N-acetylglucosamine synthase-like glycosyltransferase
VAEALFWLCLFLPFFVYLGYPCVLALYALFLRKEPPVAPQAAPGVSVIVAAYNEARNIEAKLQSLLQASYPGPQRQIIIASDGSSDATVTLARQIAQAHPQQDIQVLDLPRTGKAGALNRAVAAATGEILVFSDADTLWRDDTLAQLVAPFADPRVGAVAGTVAIASAGQALAVGDKLYRGYESWVRRLESRTGCLASADGGLQALRRSLFQPIPQDVTDDFFLITCAAVADQRIVFAGAAQVIDCGVETAGNQFRRRLRITTRGLQSLAQRRSLLNPRRHGLLACGLLTHKLIRRLVPLLLVPLLLSNVWLWEQGAFYRLTLLAQFGGYGLGLVGLLGRHRPLPKPFRVLAFVLISQAAIGLGVWNFICGQRYSLWNPQQNR